MVRSIDRNLLLGMLQPLLCLDTFGPCGSASFAAFGGNRECGAPPQKDPLRSFCSLPFACYWLIDWLISILQFIFASYRFLILVWASCSCALFSTPLLRPLALRHESVRPVGFGFSLFLLLTLAFSHCLHRIPSTASGSDHQRSATHSEEIAPYHCY